MRDFIAEGAGRHNHRDFARYLSDEQANEIKKMLNCFMPTIRSLRANT